MELNCTSNELYVHVIEIIQPKLAAGQSEQNM